jgi:hypothetical protein
MIKIKSDVQPVLFGMQKRLEREPADTISDTSAGQLKARPGTELDSPQRQTTEAEKMGEKEERKENYTHAPTHTQHTHTHTHTPGNLVCLFGFYLFFFLSAG